MKKADQIKRKHHYVWGHYLKSWSLNDRDVCHLTPQGNLACSSVKGLTQERDFYKINFFTREDIEFISSFSEQFSDEMKQNCISLIKPFILVSRWTELLKKSPHSVPEEISTALKIFEHNSLEDLHSQHEKEALEVLTGLNSGDLSVLENSKNKINFLCYFGIQVMRTKAILDRFKIAISDNKISSKESFEVRRYNDLLFKNWWFISYILGINVGGSLFFTRNNNRHILLKNHTNEPFITSDMPIINVHESIVGLEKYQAPEKADFYYPISPKYAYMINESDRYPQGKVTVTEADAIKFNNLMYLNFHEYVFAQTREQIQEVQKRNKAVNRYK